MTAKRACRNPRQARTTSISRKRCIYENPQSHKAPVRKMRGHPTDALSFYIHPKVSEFAAREPRKRSNPFLRRRVRRKKHFARSDRRRLANGQPRRRAKRKTTRAKGKALCTRDFKSSRSARCRRPCPFRSRESRGSSCGRFPSQPVRARPRDGRGRPSRRGTPC